jgi:HAD superfamily hydrolase (TIGR01549 family)
VRGLVFDLDDTLFDQKDWIVRKLRLLWLAEQAWLPPERDFMRATLAILEEGERARLFDAYVQTQGLGEAERQRLIVGFRAAQPAAGRLYADVAGALAQLRRKGLRLGLLTDNPAASQRLKLERTGLAAALDAVVLTGELGHAKPHSAAFDAVAQGLELPAAQLVMVGDHLFRDTLGALDAGYRHAFHVQRPGGFFNFDLGLCGPLLPAGRWSVLKGLQELDWYLDKA